jgi:hypothetical protein
MDKGGIEDLKKAMHYLQRMLEDAQRKTQHVLIGPWARPAKNEVDSIGE